MGYLPDEIWLHIASYCEVTDLWLSFRNVNQQLHRCAEHYFEDRYIPEIELHLLVSIPSYDMRNPQRGRAIFRPEMRSTSTAANESIGRVTLRLLETAPDHYHSHFMARWRGMQRSNTGGLNDRMHWRISINDTSSDVRLKDAVFEQTKDDEAARLSFDWRFPVTALFQHHRASTA
jgi:hypothetical protein